MISTHDGRFLARVDAAWLDERIVVELDGARWHAPLARWAGDLARQNELQAAGWRVLRFTYWQVVSRPDAVLDTLHSTFSAR